MPMADTSIDWAGTYSCSWRVMEVNPRTWADGEQVRGATGADVTLRSSLRLLLSGTVSLDADPGWDDAERWCRVELLAEQGGVTERHAVATLLLSRSPSRVSVGSSPCEMEGRSSLAPAEDELLLAGTTCPMGVDGAAWAASMLSCCPAPVTVAGSFTTSGHTVFAAGTSRLEAARKVLDDAGWCMQVAGDGSITILEVPTEPTMALDRRAARLLGPSVSPDDGRTAVPNRFTAADGDESATVIDDDGSCATSYPRRGRWVDRYDGSPDLRPGETLVGYAHRMLDEAKGVTGKRSYERAWVPGVTVGDVLRASLPEAVLVGDMRISEQRVSLGAGVNVSETVEVMG